MNKHTTLLASAVRAATNNSGAQLNENCRGVEVVVDVTVAPGVDTVTPTIQGYDATSGKWYTILVGPAISAISTNVLRVYPGTVAAANASANDVIPAAWRLLMTHSGVGNFTYSAGANLVV